ncbi:MAG: HAD-IA family hydrolase [Betaproteobacteria bacterium]|nr:HAD-IA family hydrolase [Betaproteobacteria bacterium]
MQSPLPVDALLFDLGGVVLEIDFGRVFSAWASFSGACADSIAARFRVDAPYEAHERGEIDAARYFASLRRSLGIDLPDEDFAAGWNALFVGEVPGVRSLLRQAAQAAPLYAFSNTNQAHAQYWMREYHEIVRPFRGLFLSSDLRLRKPAPAAFHAVAGRIGVAPQRIAFFDDLAENVEGARAAGLKAFQVRSAREIALALRNELGIDCHL